MCIYRCVFWQVSVQEIERFIFIKPGTLPDNMEKTQIFFGKLTFKRTECVSLEKYPPKLKWKQDVVIVKSLIEERESKW